MRSRCTQGRLVSSRDTRVLTGGCARWLSDLVATVRVKSLAAADAVREVDTMSLSSPVPEPPEVHTTELDWADQARRDGWVLSNGQWQRDGRGESYDDGDWVYLGDGVWEDDYIASLPADTRRDVLHRYTATVAEAVDAGRRQDARSEQRQDRDR